MKKKLLTIGDEAIAPYASREMAKVFGVSEEVAKTEY